MRENLLRSKLRRGEATFGVIAPNRDAGLAETIGLLGWDFYMIDAEHGAVDASDVEDVVRGCEVAAVTPLARIRAVDAKLILQFMDAGVMGVMMPGIKTADDVRRLVDAVKYPPLGSRGLGPVRAAEYMLGAMPQAEYVRFANEQTLVLPQIEDAEALDHLEEMVRVEGVDGFVVGPRDLAMSMGFYDGPNHPEVREAIDRAWEAVRGAGLVVGTVAATGEQARGLVERGAQICLNSVSGLLKAASADFLQVARDPLKAEAA